MSPQRGLLLCAAVAVAAAVLVAPATAGYVWRAVLSGKSFHWGEVQWGLLQPPGGISTPCAPARRLVQRRPLTAHMSGCLQAPPWPAFNLVNSLAVRWLPLLQAKLLPPHGDEGSWLWG